jgi:hypothetical protein
MRATVAHLAEPPDHQGQLEVLVAGPDGRATARLGATDAQQAVAWARERADEVRVHIWDCSTLWSAGNSNPDNLPEWPGMEEAMRLRTIAASAAAVTALGGGVAAAQSGERGERAIPEYTRPAGAGSQPISGDCKERADRGDFGPDQGWMCVDDETP